MITLSIFTCSFFCFQRREEWTRAGAARAQEGDHSQPALCRWYWPRRTGQHALPGLLQRQKQAAKRPSVRWVSDWRCKSEGWRRESALTKEKEKPCEKERLWSITVAVGRAMSRVKDGSIRMCTSCQQMESRLFPLSSSEITLSCLLR